jgi:two-component system cell cycle response regulator DivK
MAGQDVSGGGGPLILVVEDYDDTRALLSLTLSKRGYRVVTASDGMSGYGLALSERPDLILMDIHMPGLDGLSVTRLLREREETRGVPIVAVSAYGAQEMREKAREAGCDAYIETPVGPEELIEKIGRLL